MASANKFAELNALIVENLIRNKYVFTMPPRKIQNLLNKAYECGNLDLINYVRSTSKMGYTVYFYPHKYIVEIECIDNIKYIKHMERKGGNIKWFLYLFDLI